MRRTKEEAEQTRQAVLQAALTNFSTRGYSATTLDHIAQTAGVTRGAIYWHFKNKKDLFAQLMQVYSEEYAALTVNAIQKGGSFEEIGKRVMTEPLSIIEQRPDLADFIDLANFKITDIAELAEVRQGAIQSSQMLIEQVVGFMEMGITQGALRNTIDPRKTALSYLAALNGLIYLWIAMGKNFSLAAAAEEAAEIFMRGIRN